MRWILCTASRAGATGSGSPGASCPNHLRFGVQFGDGGKATNLGPPMRPPGGDAARGLVLQPGSGRAGGMTAEIMYWVLPLPPPGPLRFVCEWPKHGIPVTTREVSADVIRDAATRAIELWPGPDEGGADDAHAFVVSIQQGEEEDRPTIYE